MGVFEKYLDDLLKFVVAQATVLLITSALAVPAQKSVEPPSACLAGYDMYLRTNLLRYYLVCCLFISSSLAIGLKVHVKTAGGLPSLSAGGKKAARAAMIVAVLFSAAASGVAVATHSYFQQSTTVLRSCMPAFDRFLITSSYAGIAVACIACPTFAFLKAAAFASE